MFLQLSNSTLVPVRSRNIVLQSTTSLFQVQKGAKHNCYFEVTLNGMCPKQNTKKRNRMHQSVSGELVEPPGNKSLVSKMRPIFGLKTVFSGKKKPTFWVRMPRTFPSGQRLQDRSQFRATMDPDNRCWAANIPHLLPSLLHPCVPTCRLLCFFQCPL